MGWKDFVPWKSEASALRQSDPFSVLQKRINSLFNDFGGEVGGLFGKDSKLEEFLPKVNVTESAEAVTITAELPGIEQKDVQLNLEDNVLTLSGERKHEQERTEGKGIRYVESSFGSFRRVIPLEVEIEEDKVEASMKNGILTVTLPKSANARRKSKTISVKAG